MTLGTLIDALQELREQKRQLEEQIKPITKRMEEIQSDVIKLMQDQGTPKASGTKASASVAEAVVPTVKDWTAVEAFIKENDAFYLMERRVSSAAYRELRQMIGDEIPGIEPFNRITLNLRSI